LKDAFKYDLRAIVAYIVSESSSGGGDRLPPEHSAAASQRPAPRSCWRGPIPNARKAAEATKAECKLAQTLRRLLGGFWSMPHLILAISAASPRLAAPFEHNAPFEHQ
jgi:hypothetical protein